MVESRLTRTLLRLGAGATLAFVYLPLIVIGFLSRSNASDNTKRLAPASDLPS